MRKVFERALFSNTNIKESYEILIINKVQFNGADSEKILYEINRASKFKRFDLIFFLGDLFLCSFDKVKNKDLLKDFLRSLDSKFGTYAVLGSKDTCEKEFLKERKQFYEDANVTLLLDKTVLINNDFVIGGRKIDRRLEIADLTGSLEENTVNIIFDSTDIYATRSLDENCDLLICGENSNNISHLEKDSKEIYKVPKLKNKSVLGRKLVFTELTLKNESDL